MQTLWIPPEIQGFALLWIFEQQKVETADGILI